MRIVQSELSIIASRMQQPGYREKTLWIIKDGNDSNAYPRHLAGQSPKVYFKQGKFRLRQLAAIMTNQMDYETVIKCLKNNDYIDIQGTATCIEKGIATTTLKTQAMIENEVTGDEKRFTIPELVSSSHVSFRLLAIGILKWLLAK